MNIPATEWALPPQLAAFLAEGLYALALAMSTLGNHSYARRARLLGHAILTGADPLAVREETYDLLQYIRSDYNRGTIWSEPLGSNLDRLAATLCHVIYLRSADELGRFLPREQPELTRAVARIMNLLGFNP